MTLASVPLIPRAVLFGNPTRFAGTISPDGEWLGWIAPRDGVNNIWVAPRERPEEARCLTDERARGINGFQWMYDGRHLLYERDEDGDEQFHVYAVDRATAAVRDLTPEIEGRVFLQLAGRDVPDAIVVGVNARDPRHADLFRVELATSERTLLLENDGFSDFILDRHYQPRLATRNEADGSLAIFRREQGAWQPMLAIDPIDARVSGPLGLDRDGETMFMLDSRGRDTAALTAVSLASGDSRVLHESQRADIVGTLTDPQTYWPQACIVARERSSHVVLDARIRADVEQLDRADIGDWSVTSRSMDDRWWTIGAASDQRPGVTWLLDRETRALTKLYDSRPDLAAYPLVAMRSLTIRSRDGMEMVSYLTLPPLDAGARDANRPKSPLPMVLVVHGGPWSRDGFGFRGDHQWLANRGYAVLSVNFRGSSGFGKAFLAAGDGEWGAAMDDDLNDAVDWAIAEGIADPAMIAIMGASYGGYATLSAMTHFPERYACGVDIVGPSNLETLLEATPAWWEAMRAMLHCAIGDPGTAEGRAKLRERSPLHRAGRIMRPLLIGQGANDPRVRQVEADQMAAAMRAHGIPVTYLLFPDEGHGFARPANAVSFNAVTEAFLAQWLGGRCEPISACDMAGSSMKIVEGADWLRPRLPDSAERSAP